MVLIRCCRTTSERTHCYQKALGITDLVNDLDVLKEGRH